MGGKIERIILVDFKSYKGRVSVGPFKDFTCIVGPNGGGKSNLMDALSMALSTSSSAIRGIPLREFINRQSRASECSVTVVLSHCASTNTTETSFTRRVDRSNTSHFLLNGKLVSEQTYFEKLAEFRICRRVGNCIVFQHEVESVTQKTPLQITELLEEVSGSATLRDEYNRRKKALMDSNELLSKASVEKRGATVEANQIRLVKKDVEHFNALQEQCRQERWNLAMSELLYVENALVQQKAQVARFQESLSVLQKSIPSESQIRDMKQQYISQHKKYLQELRDSQSTADELRSKEALLNRLKASIEYLSRQQLAHKKDIDRLGSENASRMAELQRLQVQKAQYEKLLEEFDRETAEDNQKMMKAAGSLTGADLAEYHRLQVEVECQTVTKRQQRETLQQQMDALSATLQQCKTALEHKQRRRADLSDNMKRLQQQKAELEQRKSDLLHSLKALENQIKDAQKSHMEAKKRHSEREADLLKIQEQLRELRHAKDTDKQHTRTMDIIQGLKSLYSVKGRLVDLCSIPDNTYRNALTVALGKNLDALIVDTTETAIKCVGYLKEQRLPSMTFLPLSSVNGKQVTDKLRTFGGSCKPLVDVVRFAPELEAAIRYSLGDTLVCDTLAEAKKVAYYSDRGERYKVVTLDGTVLMKNGTIQGGLASIESRAKKWDDKRYEELRAARDRLAQEAVAGGEAEMARAAVEIRDMGSRLDFTKERLKVVVDELVANALKIQNLSSEDRNVEEQENILKEKETQYLTEQENISRMIMETNNGIEEIASRVFADLNKRVNITELLEAERKQEECSREWSKRRQQLVLVIHRLNGAIEAEDKRQSMKSFRDAEGVYDRTEKEISQSKEKLAALEEECKRVGKTNATTKKNLMKMRDGLDKLQLSIRQMTQSSEKELYRLALARQGGSTLESACEGLRQRRINIVRRCQMEGVEIPVKPVSGAGSKRRRDEGDSSNSQASSGSGVLLKSAPFTLAETLNSKNNSESSQEGDEQGTLYVDFSGIPDSLRSVAERRETLMDYQQRTQSLVEKLTVECEALAPHVKAASRLGSSTARLDQSSSALEEARERVRQANVEFQEVRKRRTALFLDIYEKMAAKVDQIYKELTIGTRSRGATGSAYLSLEDPEDPYLGGTAYHVTPPMKRFMPMEMLSGGERTMAALAFLFSIHAVSPSPFFVLDEVDAALDAANVEKLARFVRQNCHQCQFVVVSHKDQLYYLADVLLGVTSEKKEVSQVISLDLRGYSF